ncbi:MAG TPA: hypothetical protein VLK84_17285 [Longimicrobium sp.]|nr:hypothetical protein [Longimicrobium sp.]
MAENPSVWGRMVARFQGEVPGSTLEAYRRASLPVLELMDRAEARREACIADGLDPWTIPPATRAELLCAWNAFVLQTVGNDILNADYTDDADTAGYVPRVTADQLMSFFGQVEGWMDRAHQAQANPDYRLDVEVPARLPPWSEVDPSPPSHLRGLLKAMGAVGEHAAAAMRVLPDTAPAGPEQAERQKQIHRIRQLYASAQSKARYAAELHGAAPSPDVRGRVEPYMREALERFYELGQLIADPALARGGLSAAPVAPPAGNPPEGDRPLLPSDPGFDKLVLTAPAARNWLRTNGEARVSIDRFWRQDPDPAATLAIHAEIEAALARGDVAYATNPSTGRRVGPWYRCPWGPVYVARRELRLDGVLLRVGEQFVYDVGVWDDVGDGTFTRRIRPGAVHPTRKAAYLHPGAPA